MQAFELVGEFSAGCSSLRVISALLFGLAKQKRLAEYTGTKRRGQETQLRNLSSAFTNFLKTSANFLGALIRGIGNKVRSFFDLKSNFEVEEKSDYCEKEESVILLLRDRDFVLLSFELE